MNMMPQKPCAKWLFSRKSTAFNGGPFVYTEDVGGSSPSSPTTKTLINQRSGGLFTKLPVGSENLKREFFDA